MLNVKMHLLLALSFVISLDLMAVSKAHVKMSAKLGQPSPEFLEVSDADRIGRLVGFILLVEPPGMDLWSDLLALQGIVEHGSRSTEFPCQSLRLMLPAGSCVL